MRYTLLIAAILAVLRVWIGATIVPVTPTLVDVYKDIAHLFMGGLLTAWALQKQSWQGWLFGYMCLLEVSVALYSRL